MYRENCEKSIPAMYDFQYEYDDNKKDDMNTYKYIQYIYVRLWRRIFITFEQ